MWRDGATVLVLRPGRETLRIRLSARWPQQLLGLLLVPVLMGAAGRHGWEAMHTRAPEARAALTLPQAAHGTDGRVAIAARPKLAHSVTPAGASAPSLAEPVERIQRVAHHELGATRVELQPLLTAVTRVLSQPSIDERDARVHDARVVDAQPIVRAFRARAAREARLNEAVALLDPSTPFLLHAVHLGESARIQAFDAQGMPQAEAFAAVTRLMRCRVTGEEVATDPRLVRLLARLGAAYGRPIQLISGHRAVHTLGTSPTSQHALGRAADIRIAGVSIEDLRRRAIELGAMGVGLYPEKGFVHVDVRSKARFHWAYTEATGEQPYEQFLLGGARVSLPSTFEAPESTSGESE